MTSSRPPRRASRHRGVTLFTALVATFAVLVGGYVAMSRYLAKSSPGSVVTSYFAALAGDDAARALSYGTVPGGDHEYLTAAVLRDQLAAGAISDVQVMSIDEQSRNAQVGIYYQLRSAAGTSNVSDVVPLVRAGRQWRLAESAVPTTVGLRQATRRAALAGTAFPAGPVAMFPGALPVTFDTPNLMLEASGSTVDFDGGDDAALTVTVSSAGVSAARSAVAAALAACLSGASISPQCPQPTGANLRIVPGTLRGALSATGTSALTVAVTGDADGVLTITGTVDVTGSYKSLDFDNIASAVTSSTIFVPVAAHCYASALPASLRWGPPT
jgi:hypothetical protein